MLKLLSLKNRGPKRGLNKNLGDDENVTNNGKRKYQGLLKLLLKKKYEKTGHSKRFDDIKRFRRGNYPDLFKLYVQ